VTDELALEAFRSTAPSRFRRIVDYEGFEPMLETYPCGNAPQRKAMQRIRTWLDEAVEQDPCSNWLILHGPVGCGKTLLALAATDYLMRHSHSVATAMFVSVDELMDSIRATWNQPNSWDREADLLQPLLEVDVLILDDLAASESWQAKRLDRLIRYRHAHDKACILTTNLQGAALGKYLGEASESRLAEVATAVSFKDCPDLRLKRRPRSSLIEAAGEIVAERWTEDPS
jgi:DNA replication protein DnaC